MLLFIKCGYIIFRIIIKALISGGLVKDFYLGYQLHLLKFYWTKQKAQKQGPSIKVRLVLINLTIWLRESRWLGDPRSVSFSLCRHFQLSVRLVLSLIFFIIKTFHPFNITFSLIFIHLVFVLINEKLSLLAFSIHCFQLVIQNLEENIGNWLQTTTSFQTFVFHLS